MNASALHTEKPSNEKTHIEAPDELENISKSIPGTTLKCLEDPSFEFDTTQAPVKAESCTNQSPPAKKPAYRVLEGKTTIKTLT